MRLIYHYHGHNSVIMPVVRKDIQYKKYTSLVANICTLTKLAVFNILFIH